MEIHPGAEIVDLGIYLKRHRTLIVGDIHLGYEHELNLQGVLLPKFHFQDIIERMKPILEHTKPSQIILNGDIKHEFGSISEEEWRQSMHLLDLLTHYAPVLFVKGNHDTILKPIAEHAKVRIVDHVFLDPFFICHGDILLEHLPTFKEAGTVIIGHEHPAITLHDGVRAEKYKCYLKGHYKKKILVVMPSFFQIHEGSDVLQEQLLSPYLADQDISRFEAFIVEPIRPGSLNPKKDNVYAFGQIRKIAGK